mgnify:CR=1 FL=1
MQRATISKIDELMKQKRWDEAQGLMTDFFSSDTLYEEERGRAFITYTFAYLEALIKINMEYQAALELALTLLKKNDLLESDLKRDIDLARLHNEIANLKQ